MIHLALVRHAKSSWSDRALSDHDRPLNDRGRAEAPRMAHQFAEYGFRPDTILTSTAVRARTTAELFAAELGVAPIEEPELYGASAATLLQHATADGRRSVLVVAHDPGISVLAGRLSRNRIDGMPTCAVATFTWEGDDWSIVDAIDPVDWTFETPH